MADPDPPLTRREQRRRSEARILATASAHFSRFGYDRTTIRGVAADAGVDPGLVMHYFGSKRELFLRAAGLGGSEEVPPPGTDLLEALLADLRVKLASSSAAELAVLRSMLTHPDAASEVRTSVDRQLQAVSAVLPVQDAALRASLIGALLIGVTVGRDLLELDGLAEADPEAITRLLRPCLAALLGRGETPQE